MPAVHEVIQRLEGLIGITPTNLASADTGRVNQAVATWVEGCKMIMRQQSLRLQTDWDLVMSDGVIQTGSAPDATSGTLYALLIRHDDSDAERDWVAVFDAAATTFDGTAALANTVLIAYQPAATATNNISEYDGLLFPSGVIYGTGLSFSVDGRDGTDPAATDKSVYALIRT